MSSPLPFDGAYRTDVLASRATVFIFILSFGGGPIVNTTININTTGG